LPSRPLARTESRRLPSLQWLHPRESARRRPRRIRCGIAEQTSLLRKAVLAIRSPRRSRIRLRYPAGDMDTRRGESSNAEWRRDPCREL